MEYMYELKGELHGPVSHQQLAELIRDGRLSPSTNVLKKGQTQWKRASDYFAKAEITPDSSQQKASVDVNEGNRVWAYVVNHWCGQTSLAQAFWINGFALSILIGVITELLFSMAPDNPIELKPYAYMALVVIAVELIVRVWQWVGIYRTAINAEVVTKPVWCTWAKLSVIVGALLLIYNFNSLVLISGDLLKLANYQDDMGSFTAQLGSEQQRLIYEGPITAGSPEAIEELLERHPEIKTIELNSPGGFLGPAYRIGKILQQHGVQTAIVRDECASACTLALLSVKQRLLIDEGSIGFHQPDDAVDTHLGKLTIGEDIKAMQEWLRKHGVSDVFAERAMRTPPTKMFFAEPLELMQHGVITEFQLADQRISQDDMLVMALQEKFRVFESILALQEFHPTEYQKLIKLFAAELKSNKWLHGYYPETGEALGRSSYFALAKASNETLRPLFKRETEAMRELKNQHPSVCAELAGFSYYEGEYPAGFYLFREEQDRLLADAYRSMASNSERSEDESKANWAYIRVETQLKRDAANAHRIFVGQPARYLDHESLCQSALDIRDRVDALPDDLFGAFARRYYATSTAPAH
ncbi:DUF4339 domain-containing protein [Permianibacter aggregans]|uniref:Uncharacterized protein DUF4339 n=2 Tax=Permianibacter aggregans TaxID=1510150 RepID=A0A4V3D724_9GAMM|nr:DUF4339 domain-containing protein [Permianibacter aggregans]TDQ46237.1 uncharacterized protein DUF4339 [Permianibacter aggregans]